MTLTVSCGMYLPCTAGRHDFSEWSLNADKCGCIFCKTGNRSSLTPLMHSFAYRQCTDGRSKTNIHSSPKAIHCNLRVVCPQASAVFSVFCGLYV